MKVAVLAGGMGTRLVEETRAKSKALVEIGGRPILWHILRYYAHFGFNQFVIALGYRAETIQDYFAGLAGLERAAVDDPEVRQRWQGDAMTVDLVDTGLATESGGRVKRLAPYLGEGTFMLTWCDGLADVDLPELLAFHRRHGRLATLSAVRPPARFGRLALDGEKVRAFDEKVLFENEWINGAFFVLEPGVIERIAGDEASFERDVLQPLAAHGELMAYRHTGFWQCMDTLKEAQDLDRLWRSKSAPWKVWS
jgi:glucose-1-phosphate cytidylyltransferase